MKIRELLSNVRPSNIVWHIEDGFIGSVQLLRDVVRGVRIEYRARQLADAQDLANHIATRAPIEELREITERTDQLLKGRHAKFTVTVPKDKVQS
jgi:hypothetical protein